MNFFKAIAIFFLFFLCLTSFAQDVRPPSRVGKNDTIPVQTITVNGETMPHFGLPEVQIRTTFLTAEDRARFNRLKYNVLKVLPYARYAHASYEKLQQDLAVTSDKREQRRLVKACDQQIKDMFNREVKKMTITQGHILIKLIDRETGTDTYDLVRQLKGGVSAFMYQTIARVVGHNLKDQYDPENEDRAIENIIRIYAVN